MSKINKQIYDIKTDKIDKKIILLTDLHYYQAKDIKKLNKVLDALKSEHFDYICLSGDIIDIGSFKDINLYVDWIKKISLLSPVIIGLGGHDLIHSKKNKQYYYNHEFFDQIKKIPNVHLLDNETYIDGDIRFIGLTLPIDYYYKYHENVNYFKRFVNNTFDTFEDKYNILLLHTPIPLTKLDNYDDIKLLKNISLVLSGHTHAGIVPLFLREKMNGVGFFSPCSSGYFPKDCYGQITKEKMDIIISSGVSKAPHSNPFSFVDYFFDREITYINLKKK